MPPLNEQQEQLRQERNLGLLKWVIRLAVLALVITGLLLYLGVETLPNGMRFQPWDATGYQAPPVRGLANASVPRNGVEPVLPDLPNGAVPPQAAALTNPMRNDPTAVVWGKQQYTYNCAMCHGVSGRGDGPVSDSYQPHATDLTLPRVQGESDGTLFYKITNGILSTPFPDAAKYEPREWHGWRNEMSTAQRWQVITYLRTLRGGTPAPAQPPTPVQQLG